MIRFRNIRIASKLAICFSVMIALLAGVGWFAIVKLGELDRSTRQLAATSLPNVERQLRARLAISRVRSKAMQEIVAVAPADRDRFAHEKNELATEVDRRLAEISRAASSDEQKRAVADYAQAWSRYFAVDAPVEQLLRAGKREQALALVMSQQPLFDNVNDQSQALTTRETENAERDSQSTSGVYAASRSWIMGALSLALAFGALLALFVSKLIVRPLHELSELTRKMATGDVEQQIEYRGSDEVGLLADSLRGVIAYIVEISRAMERVGKGDLTVEVEPRGERDLLVHSFQSAVQSLQETLTKMSGTSISLSGAAEELSAVSKQMGASAEGTSNQANVVAAAAEQVSKNVQTVASSADEMSASVKEVAKNAGEAARVASTAVRVAENANVIVTKLGASSAEIGKVIKVITSIAEQTNLLALNATIEAARAGEAGKGFAVVANEVKELAKETAKATEDISRKIAAIQGDTKEAVDAIADISHTIGRVNHLQTMIAGAVEEQAATTNEIGRNVSEAARATSDIAENIAGVASAAQSTSSGAAQCQEAALELAKMSTEMQSSLALFSTREPGAVRLLPAGEAANENSRPKRPKLVAA